MSFRIDKNIEVPTGNICVLNCTHGPLEFISVGDYGKDVNMKADFLGLSREPEQVQHTTMLPLTEKWVITVSTQYGCGMGCPNCDAPLVGKGKNATFEDLCSQISAGMSLHPEVTTNRLNIHFARMGEPTWNPNVLKCAEWLHETIAMDNNVHPVVSTMMPNKNQWLERFLIDWISIKNNIYCGNAGLQISINSTNEEERKYIFNNNACSLEQIALLMCNLAPQNTGRKITLNFAIADFEINPDVLRQYFDPEYYIIKLTPMHKSKSALLNGIQTTGDYTTYYPYQKQEEELKNVGYDVIVFIASEAEDLGRITCGNVILSGTTTDWSINNE